MPNEADNLREALERLTAAVRSSSDDNQRIAASYNKSSGGLFLPSHTIQTAAAPEARNPFVAPTPKGYDKLRSGLLVPDPIIKLATSKAPEGYDKLHSGIVVPQQAVPQLATKYIPPVGTPIADPFTPKYTQGEESPAAKAARQKAYIDVKGPGGASSAGHASANALAPAVAKTAGSFGLLNSKLLVFAGAIGAAIKGLQGTKEGYLLDYSINHVFFEIADMLRAPIRAITREIEGFAHVMHAVGSTNGGKGIFSSFYDTRDALKNIVDTGEQNKANQQSQFTDQASLAEVGARNHNEAQYHAGIRQLQAESDRLGKAIDADKKEHPLAVDIGFGGNGLPGIGWHKDPNVALKEQYDMAIKKNKELHDNMAGKPAQNTNLPPSGHQAGGETKSKAEPPLQPQLTVSFGDVAGLQSQMQKLATENPAQEKGLSLVEQIAKAVFTIAYGGDEANKMFPDQQQQPAVKHG